MIRGRVVGSVWATRKSPYMAGHRLLLVVPTDAAGRLQRGGRVVVAIDPVGARHGEEVLVSFGSGARNAVRPGPGNRRMTVDAAVTAILDGWTTPTVDEGGEAERGEGE